MRWDWRGFLFGVRQGCHVVLILHLGWTVHSKDPGMLQALGDEGARAPKPHLAVVVKTVLGSHFGGLSVNSAPTLVGIFVVGLVDVKTGGL